MSTFQTQDTAVPFDDAQIATIVNALITGASIGDVCNVSPDTLEGLYTLGYNFYTAGNYGDAETVFQSLCLYKHTDVRFWTGLAGCRQATNNLKGAIDAYSLAGVMGGLSDPQPFLFAAQCFIKLGDRESAIGTLKALLTMGTQSDAAHVACRAKAEELLKLLETQE